MFFHSCNSGLLKLKGFQEAPPYKVGNLRLDPSTKRFKRIGGSGGSVKDEVVSAYPHGLLFSLKTNTGPINWEFAAKKERYSTKGFEEIQVEANADFRSIAKIRIPIGAKDRSITFKPSWKADPVTVSLQDKGTLGSYLRVTGFSKVDDEEVYQIETVLPKHLKR